MRFNGRTILATLNVVDDAYIVGCHELGLSEGAYAQFGVKEGQTASVAQAEPPASISALHRKIAGERLDANDFRLIVQDIANLRYARMGRTVARTAELLFAGDALKTIMDAGVGEVWSTDCIAHASNAVSMAEPIAAASLEIILTRPCDEPLGNRRVT